MTIFTYIGYILIGLGYFFIFTTAYGFTKFKDVFRKMHVIGVSDLIGVPMIIIGCGMMYLDQGRQDILWKLIFVAVLIYLTSPVMTNTISEIACRVDMNDDVNDKK